MPSRVRNRLLIFLLLVLLVAAALLANWWLVGRHYETTDNAYVHGDITRVSSQLAAQVTEVLVTDNQTVETGDLLVRLDPRDFDNALAQARANLATREAEHQQARAQLRRQDSLIEAARAAVDARQAEQRRIELDIKRILPLRKSGYASEEQVSNFRAQLDVAKAQLRGAEAELQTQILSKETLGADIDRLAALIQAAQSEVQRAELDLSRSEIRAPVPGRVGQRSVRIGQNVQPGDHLLAIVPGQDLWVQANFKETQIKRMRKGQQVTLTFDAFGGQPMVGRIDSLFPASGAQFSLLPPDNATGNFTKVVQRIPVKITVDQQHPLSRTIRPGMSVSVKVDLRD
ncbi:putative secretion protein [Pseudomonas saudimassiliensis]|uniref:Putative secretion protein n=1 Tax=Pseudomonas saudimassiliensis TaxID=1461581 RepID=A0A078M5H8_9PSED|nr:HlyD family secretion protein [Pseudomonas saudimassiliensis]CEA01494.1 putative secretion protein [Pseudomonas saudimassiliensis]CEF25528.1 putative secretion protein [Pseudomonas saudimassiliensis]